MAEHLHYLGYHPIWQEMFDTTEGDLRAMLRRKINGAKAVVQIVGDCYGSETSETDPVFGRVSNTQYEACYAKSKGKKVWYVVPADNYTRDCENTEPEELQKLQAVYKAAILEGESLYHVIESSEHLKITILKLRNELNVLRRSFRIWMSTVVVLMLIMLGHSVFMGIEFLEFKEARAITDTEADRKSREEITNIKTARKSSEERSLDQTKAIGATEEAAIKLMNRPEESSLTRAKAAYLLEEYESAFAFAYAAIQSNDPEESVNGSMLLGSLALAKRDYSTAERAFRKVIDQTNRKDDFERWLKAQSSLAYTLFKGGKTSEALPVYKRVVDVRMDRLGVEDPETLASMNDYAVVLLESGKLNDAKAIFSEVLAVREQTLPSEDSRRLGVLMNLGHIAQELGDYDEAVGLFNRVTLEARFGDETLRLEALYSSANLHSWLENYSTAERKFKDLLPFYEKKLGMNSGDTLRLMNARAWNLYCMGDFEEAMVFASDALGRFRQLNGRYPADYVRTLDTYAQILIQLERGEEGLEVFAMLVEEAKANELKEMPEVWESMIVYAELLDSKGKNEEGEEIVRLAHRWAADTKNEAGAAFIQSNQLIIE